MFISEENDVFKYSNFSMLSFKRGLVANFKDEKMGLLNMYFITYFLITKVIY